MRQMLCLSRILLILAIASAIAMHSGRLAGYSLEPKLEKAPPTLAQVREIFESAQSLESADGLYAVRGAGGEKLGDLLDSRGKADNVIGYASSIPLLIGMAEGKVAGILIQENAETPEFLEKIRSANLFSAWNGKTPEEILASRMDAVTGATMTSTAVIDTVRATFAQKGDAAPAAQASPWTLDAFAALAVLVFALACFFGPARLRKWRNWSQAVSVAVLGFWLGWFVALAQLHGWLVHGTPWRVRPVLVFVTLCALLLPLLTRKNFHCMFLCPYGACQELLGKLRKRKLPPPSWARNLQPMVFATIAMLLLVGMAIDLTKVEPFSAFLFQSASPIVIGMAVLFLVASLFWNRPWCNFFCPTGQLLEILRKVAPKSDKEKRT